MYSNKSKKRKLQFDFSQKAVSRLDGLVKSTESTSRAEVIRRSLKLYEIVNEKYGEGYSLELTKDDDRTKLEFI